jgi:branched-subunit amino acid aminotransferase/4-amino-4-deoxychorismate lyase
MLGWLWNGQEFASAASVPLSDRGFRYGMSLFESLAVQDGVVEYWGEHRRRLLTGCIERDFPVDEAGIDAAKDVLANAGMNGFARVYVTAGDGGPAAPAAPRIFAMIEEREREKEESWEICFSEEPWAPIFAGLKTANYWKHCEALSLAKAKRFDEAVLFNDHAELVSVCCGNIFLVHDDKISTPGRASGCRLGVAREWVCKRRKVEERRLRREDLLAADEVFISNCWLGVMPIATIEGRPLGPRRIGPKLSAEWEIHPRRE